MKIIDEKIMVALSKLRTQLDGNNSEVARKFGISRAHVGNIFNKKVHYFEDSTWERVEPLLRPYMDVCENPNDGNLLDMLRDYMRVNRIDQNELAEKIKVSPATVSRWFSGKSEITEKNKAWLSYILKNNNPYFADCLANNYVRINRSNSIVSELVEFLQASRMQHKEFAKELGVGESTLSKMITGERPISKRNENAIRFLINQQTNTTPNPPTHFVIELRIPGLEELIKTLKEG